MFKDTQECSHTAIGSICQFRFCEKETCEEKVSQSVRW